MSLPLKVARVRKAARGAVCSLLLALGVLPCAAAPLHPVRVIVGCMGGRVAAGNLVHREATLAQELRAKNIPDLHVLVYANHDGDQALRAVMDLLDQNGDHTISDAERREADVAIYGHSWGACETLHLARALQKQGVPVALTIQVDSVQKLGENDHLVPSNVAEAANIFQRGGVLRGRTALTAEDPSKTRIVLNREVHYDDAHAVDIRQFPWFARTFMKQHIEIENDPAVWNEVERLLLSVMQESRKGRS